MNTLQVVIDSIPARVDKDYFQLVLFPNFWIFYVYLLNYFMCNDFCVLCKICISNQTNSSAIFIKGIHMMGNKHVDSIAKTFQLFFLSKTPLIHFCLKTQSDDRILFKKNGSHLVVGHFVPLYCPLHYQQISGNVFIQIKRIKV